MSVSPAFPVSRLRDSSPGVGRKLASEIGNSGDEAVMTLLRFLSAEGENHVVRNHAFDALRALGAAGLGPILSYLGDFDQYDDAAQVYIAKGLIRLAGEIDAGRAEPEMIRLMHRLISVQEQGAFGRAWYFIQQIKMEIHAVLASQGCRTVLDDLMSLLGSGEELVFPVVIQSVGLIGDRRALRPLIRLRSLEGEETWLATEIRKAFRKIVRREGIDHDELRRMSTLTSSQRTSLEQLLARRRNGRS
jgi:HEAT repeat protein